MDQTTSPTPPTWLGLVLLMVHGPGHLAGEDSPGAGVDGSPSSITDGTTTWTFSPGEPAHAARERRVVFTGRGTQLLARRTAHDVLDGDLSGQPGPVRATTRLGRAAWEVEVAPGEGAEHPVQLVVHAATGLVLEQRIDAVGAIDAWTDLVIGEDVDAALFTWSGPTGGRDPLTASLERLHADQEVERAAGAAWWGEHVDQRQRSAVVETRLDLALGRVHTRDDDGSFEVGLGQEQECSLARRPRSELPWDLRRYGGPPAHRWSTQRWDWAFRLHDRTLTERGCAAVERCFGDGEPGEG